MARSEHHLPTRLPTRPSGFHATGAVDLSDLVSLSDNDNFASASGDFVHELIELFLQQTPRLLHTAEEAVRAHDGASLARACHKLESRAALFGARRLAQVCRKLEDLGHNQRLSRAESHLDDLEDELDRVHAALQRHLWG